MHIGPITVVLISAGIQVSVYNHYKEKISQRLDVLSQNFKLTAAILGAILLFIVFPVVWPDGVINGMLTALAFGLPIYVVLILLFIGIYSRLRNSR